MDLSRNLSGRSNIDVDWSPDPRETQGVTSANGFSQDECTRWLDKHPKLQNECPVDYYEIDERGF